MKSFKYLLLSLLIPSFLISYNNIEYKRELKAYDKIYTQEFYLVDSDGNVFFKLNEENINELINLLSILNTEEFEIISNKTNQNKQLNISSKELLQRMDNFDKEQIGLNEKLQKLLNRITELDKEVAHLKQAPPSAKNNDKKKRPQSDPNKEYDVAVAGSVVLGNPNAQVTVIKWTDYQ